MHADNVILNGIAPDWFTIMVLLAVITLVFSFWVLSLKKQLITYQNIEKELRCRSECDLLSGLKNRNAVVQFVQGIEDKPMSVLMCDIDGLKIINDTLGHWAGDQLIRKTALILKAACPSETAIFRMGGDEFLAVLPEGTPLSRTEKIYESVKEQILVHNQELNSVPLSLSIGIASNTADGSISDAIRQADLLMYEQKRICHERVKRSLEQALNRE